MQKILNIFLFSVFIIALILVVGCTGTAPGPVVTPTQQIVYVTVLVTPIATITPTETFTSTITPILTSIPTQTSISDSEGCPAGEYYVNGYYRQSGTYVNGYCRHYPS
jgi:uncharacterized protein YcfL